jgi:hypothetical protein
MPTTRPARVLWRLLSRSVLATTSAAALFAFTAGPVAASPRPAAPSPAALGLDGVWACTVPTGYVYDQVQYTQQCSTSGRPTTVYRLRTPVDGLTACSVPPTGWTYDLITSTYGCALISGTPATTFRLRKPANGLWACTVPTGWTYSSTGSTYDCSYLGGVPSTRYQLLG